MATYQPKLESVNPATGQIIGRFLGADGSDVDRAVAAAREAFNHGPWTSTISHKERGVILRKLAELTRSHVEELATLETLDNGKTFVESCEDVNNVADFFDYYSGWCDKFYGDVTPVMGNFFSYTVREPVGVCGQIIPWNYPMDMACRPMSSTNTAVTSTPAPLAAGKKAAGAWSAAIFLWTSTPNGNPSGMPIDFYAERY